MTLGDKIDRALNMADLTLVELAEAIDAYPIQLRRLMEDKGKPPSVPLKIWYLMSKALDVPIEYWLDDDIDDEVTQTLLTVKAIRVEHSEQSNTVRTWERHIDQECRNKWRGHK